jgi:hypothetical protein
MGLVATLRGGRPGPLPLKKYLHFYDLFGIKVVMTHRINIFGLILNLLAPAAGTVS